MAHGVRSLDDSIGTILSSLGDRTRDTLVIYLSDNGFLFGEHRRFGKENAYEGSVRVPMVYPRSRHPLCEDRVHVSRSGLERGHRADAGGGRGVPVEWDARSLAPLLEGSTKSVRSALRIQHCRGVNAGSVPCSGLSFVAQVTRVAGYWGVVTARDKYVSYDTGDRELFDLETDPSELHNLIGSSGWAATVADMEAKLAALLRPAPGMTIVTGPGRERRPAGWQRSRTSRRRVLHVALPPDSGKSSEQWHACGPQAEAFGGLATVMTGSRWPGR